MKIFVGNLPRDASEDELRGVFASHGDISRIEIIKDKYTGESRGFAFVEMPNEGQAREAIDKLNKVELKGRKLTVNEARPKTEGGGDRGGGERRGGGGGGRGGRW